MNSFSINKDYPDTYEKFIQWYHSSFIRRNGGFLPTSTEHWYNKILDQHKNLMKLLGGFRQSKRYTLSQHQEASKVESVQEIVKEIRQLVPNYLEHYGYDESVFLKPTIQTGTHNFTKLPKHISNFANSYYRNDSDYSSKTNQLGKLLSKLGEIWSRYRTSDKEIEVTISCSPQSFVLIGHYGPDHDSCFRQGSTSQRDKYSFGQSENTFVVTISEFDDKKQRNINKGRFLGFLKQNTLNFFNYYSWEGFREADSIEVCRRLSEEVFGGKLTLHESIIGIGTGLTFNKEGLDLTFSKSATASFQELHPVTHLISTFQCPNCAQKHDNDRYWRNLDNSFVCRNCYDSANECEITKVRTLLSLVTVEINGNQFQVHPNEAKKLENCKLCSIPSNGLIEADVGKICVECSDVNYSVCDICGENKKDDLTLDIGSFVICSSCCKDKREDMIDLILSDMEGEFDAIESTRNC